ncbi:MAG: AI-2E family transporter [Myxococcota bacterium]
MSETARTRNLLLTIIAAVLVGLVLHYTAPVTVLFAIAAFLAVLLRPVVRWLDGYMPRVFSMTAVVLGIGGILGGVGTAMYVQLEALLERLPVYADRLALLAGEFTVFAERLGVQIAPTAEQVMDSGVGLLTSWLGSLLTTSGTGLLILVTMFFMLTEANMIRRKLTLVFDEDQCRRIVGSLDSATRKIKDYLTTKTLVSLSTGTLTGLVTWSLDVDFPFVWASLAFLLNYIPHLGSVVATVAPTLMALVQHESPTTGMLTLMMLGSVQMVLGNIIEPRLMGRSLSLSPLVVFVSLLFWGWFWGLPGVLLAVPLTAVLKIACEHIPALRTFGLLLGDAKAVESWVAREAPDRLPPEPERCETEPVRAVSDTAPDLSQVSARAEARPAPPAPSAPSAVG